MYVPSFSWCFKICFSVGNTKIPHTLFQSGCEKVLRIQIGEREIHLFIPYTCVG